MYNTPLLQRFQEQPSALENQRPEWIQLVFKWPEKQATYVFLQVNPLQEGEKDAFQSLPKGRRWYWVPFLHWFFLSHLSCINLI